MKVWIFVEGESDRIALNTLWEKWRESLRKFGWGIQIIPLDGKSRYFRKIGPHAAEKLMHNENDLVVGLPDLYPNSEYKNSSYKHNNLYELKMLQKQLVKDNLAKVFGASPVDIQAALARFYPTAFKHDLEMLLLAAREELRKVLETNDALGNWRHPVEDQNQIKPPKYVIDELFQAKKGRKYRDTVHAKAVLEKVGDIKTVLYHNGNQLQCPVFKDLLDWIGAKTGVSAY
ncbi:MAG: DUF4276 family protein [Syntrophales bacterium]|nr:DUF4276 family protein [Syntrophales bacterium]